MCYKLQSRKIITSRHVDFHKHHFPFLEKHNEIEFNDFKLEVFHLLPIPNSLVNPYTLNPLYTVQFDYSLSCDSTLPLVFDLPPSISILDKHSLSLSSTQSPSYTISFLHSPLGINETHTSLAFPPCVEVSNQPLTLFAPF